MKDVITGNEKIRRTDCSLQRAHPQSLYGRTPVCAKQILSSPKRTASYNTSFMTTLNRYYSSGPRYELCDNWPRGARYSALAALRIPKWEEISESTSRPFYGTEKHSSLLSFIVIFNTSSRIIMTPENSRKNALLLPKPLFIAFVG